MTEKDLTSISRSIFIDDLRFIHSVSESNVYRSLSGKAMDLDAVRQFSTSAMRHGTDLGFSFEYINECLRYAFETGIRAAVAWIDENVKTADPKILSIWKGVI